MKSELDPLLVDHLRRLAEGIVAVIGPHCEVVIHDFADLEHSAVYIAGGLTGREPGAPVPDLDFITDGLNKETPDQINYKTTIEDKTLQSTTIWLRNSSSQIVGAVCINIDYSGLFQAQEIIDRYVQSAKHLSDLVVEDTFAKNLDHLIESAVKNFLKKENLFDIAEMNLEDKIRLVKALEKNGLFQIRGAVNKLADLLNVSRASIYNYRQ